MRIVPTVLLGLVLALALPGFLSADAQRVAALRTLTSYWATQTSSLGGWLGEGIDPGYVPVAPPDSSLWSPGTLLLLSESGGFQQIGSREKFIPARSIKVLGKERSDVAVLDNLVFGPGEGDRFRLQDLPGVLEAFGVVRTRSATLAEDLQAELGRFGVRRVTVSLSDAQVHRLAPSDLKVYLEEGAAEKTRLMLAEPRICVVTSAVFLRTVLLRLDTSKVAPELVDAIKKLFGTSLKLRSDGSLVLETRGIYVAIQTGRYAVPTPTGDFRREATGTLLIDTTRETRNSLARLLAKL
jgi:hypothetical protein